MIAAPVLSLKATLPTRLLSMPASIASLAPTARMSRPFIERFNRTVRQECLGWHNYTRQQFPELRSWLGDWLHYYHFVRPSMAFEPMRPRLDGLSHLT